MSTVVGQAKVGRRRIAPAANRYGLLAIPVLVLLLVVFAYPVIEILKRSFTEFIPPQVSGLDNVQWFFETKANLVVLRRTFITAIAVTGACLLLAYPYAYLMTLAKRKWLIVMLAVVLVPFWTSLMVRNYAWIVLLQENGIFPRLVEFLGFGQPKLKDSALGVGIGMAQVLLPFMVLPLYANMRNIDRRLLLAAASLGARPAVAFFRIYLPLSLPGVIAGSLLVFVLALGFFLTPALLGSPQESMLSQLIVTQVNQLLAWGRSGVMAGVLLITTLIVIGVIGLITRRYSGGALKAWGG